MSPKAFRSSTTMLTLLVIAWAAAGLLGQPAALPSTATGEWPHYGGDLKNTRYTPLDQITASNFNKLEIAWRFKTDQLGPRPEYRLEGTPLMVKEIGRASCRERV